MANLPSNRVNPAPVFAETGLDVMGHFLVKMNGRADHKVWIAVFTCFVSRAVHVELLFNMSADAMVNAIIRFAARRPGIRRFTSDCGTNLVGANNILKKEMEAWNRSSTSELQRRGLRWDFITPRTPHYGGVWERIVALFKRHLASISTGAILHVDAFNTAVVEVEGILNRRPLTALSDDPNDSEALTPNHILNPSTSGHAPLDLVQQGVNSDADSAKVQWRRAQSRVDAFWKSWRVDICRFFTREANGRDPRRTLRLMTWSSSWRNAASSQLELRTCHGRRGIISPCPEGSHPAPRWKDRDERPHEARAAGIGLIKNAKF